MNPEYQKVLEENGLVISGTTTDGNLADCLELPNLDYFVASSEISETQKNECLDKFLYLLSDDYEINPQLEDKKLQVVDEMFNDMVIKTKEEQLNLFLNIYLISFS
mgnify:CR=1 FL=1